MKQTVRVRVRVSQTLVFVALCFLAASAKKLKDVADSSIWAELDAEIKDDEVGANEVERADDQTDDELFEFHVKLREMQEKNARREKHKKEKERERQRKHGLACAAKNCHLGKECVIDENDEPICVCATACPPENNPRAMVCSTKNVTFASECELHRQKCLCHREQIGCVDPKLAHAHLDYYGPCVELTPCDDFEKGEFPLRMREWLYFVMEELAQRDRLNDKAKRMAQQAEEINQDESEQVTDTERWMIPAVWKFCELDHTHDDLVDDDELMPVTAPLKGMEHCIGSFLAECDADTDGTISKTEWIECLQLDPKLIESLELKCEEFHD